MLSAGKAFINAVAVLRRRLICLRSIRLPASHDRAPPVYSAWDVSYTLLLLLRPRWGAEYCDERVCVCVCVVFLGVTRIQSRPT